MLCFQPITNRSRRLLGQVLVDEGLLAAQREAGRKHAHRERHRRLALVLLQSVCDDEEGTQTDADALER